MRAVACRGAARTVGRRRALRLLLAVGLLAASAAGAARAQEPTLVPRPWRPAGGDSIGSWAAESRALLGGSKSTSLGPDELRAYSLQDRIARAYLRSLGPRRMQAAPELVAALDSLHLVATISQKPDFPTFVLVQFFNPTFEKYASLGFLYWFRGDELRGQPIDFKGGHGADLQVYWTGNEQAPYEAGILFYRGEGRDRGPELYYFRLLPRGDAWIPVIKGDADLHLGNKGTAAWIDLDRDAKPELISWTQGLPESLFVPCREVDCPELLTQRIYVRGGGSFRLFEQRTVASPYATFVLFLRALARGDEAFARTLVAQPAVLTKARELGWFGLRRARAFASLLGTESASWTDRLRFVYARPGRGSSAIEVRFYEEQGHWYVADITVLEQPTGPPGGARAPARPAPSTGRRPPGGKAGK